MSVFRVVVVSFYRYDKRAKRRSEYFVEADSEDMAERIGHHVARRRCWAADDHVVVGLEYLPPGTRTTICEHGDVRSKCRACVRTYNREYGRRRRGSTRGRMFGPNGLPMAKRCAAGHPFTGRCCPDCKPMRPLRAHCARNHPLTPENVYLSGYRGRVRRACIQCHRAAMRRWFANNAEKWRAYLRAYHAEWRARNGRLVVRQARTKAVESAGE